MKALEDKYVLLRDMEEPKSEEAGYLWGMLTTYVYSSPQSPVEPLALRGELLEIDPSVPSEPGSSKLAFQGWKKKDLKLECFAADVKAVSNEEAMILLGVQSFAERCRIVTENLLESAWELLPGTEVYVELKEVRQEVEAVVRYKGALPPYDGIMFGVEIQDPNFRHHGTTDGVFRCQRYFKCSAGAGMFVSFDKLSDRHERDKQGGKTKCSTEVCPPGAAVTAVDSLAVDQSRPSPGKSQPGKEEELNGSTLDSGESDLWDPNENSVDQPDFDKLRSSYNSLKTHLLSIKEKLAHREQKLCESERQLTNERVMRSRLEVDISTLKDTLKEVSCASQRTEQRLAETQDSMREQRQAFGRECEEFERRLLEEHAARAEMRKQLTRCRLELEQEKKSNTDLRCQLSEAQEATKNCQDGFTRLTAGDAVPGSEESRDWVIGRDEVRLTEKSLGTGGFGVVREGSFRGCKVAVKQIHELVVSPHNRRLFEREMRIASQCRHPCLLQFIGATNDDGAPLFVSELLDTNLRAVLEQRALEKREIVAVAMDVSRALNYLHLNKPLPIIHRDISSANVLLWRRNSCWRAKVSDYGAANFMRQCRTVNPGAVIYAAPEAFSAEQSTKIDVYSFGMLLCEMCIRELPVPQQSREQVAMVTEPVLKAIIERSVREEPAQRPTMGEVLEELERLESAVDL